MASLTSKDFWKAALERAVKTFAQTLAAAITVTGVAGILDVAWPAALSASALASLLSVLTSVASDAATGGTGPSLTTEEIS